MVESAYAAFISWGFAPSEFWKMHPQEFWWIAAAKMPEKFRMSVDDWAELYEALA